METTEYAGDVVITLDGPRSCWCVCSCSCVCGANATGIASAISSDYSATYAA